MEQTYIKLSAGHTLNQQEAEKLMLQICRQKFNEQQNAFILGIFKSRSLDLAELTGFRDALMKLCIPIQLNRPAIDVCGTGGDNKNTFNISTLSAFVLAASGIPVAKHGNFASTSVSGSSDILKYFGYQFKTSQLELNEELEEYNLCFIHAPNFHPALKNIAPIRKGLMTSTLFNLMGPLVNPAQPPYKYVGVYSKSVARLYNYFFQATGTHYNLVHSLDGYDEISLTSDILLYNNSQERLIEKDNLLLPPITAQDISAGNSIESAAGIFLAVLKNEATEAQTNVVLINSAMAMTCFINKPLTECIALCRESIESKRAYRLFSQIINH